MRGRCACRARRPHRRGARRGPRSRSPAEPAPVEGASARLARAWLPVVLLGAIVLSARGFASGTWTSASRRSTTRTSSARARHIERWYGGDDTLRGYRYPPLLRNLAFAGLAAARSVAPDVMGATAPSRRRHPLPAPDQRGLRHPRRPRALPPRARAHLPSPLARGRGAPRGPAAARRLLQVRRARRDALVLGRRGPLARPPALPLDPSATSRGRTLRLVPRLGALPRPRGGHQVQCRPPLPRLRDRARARRPARQRRPPERPPRRSHLGAFLAGAAIGLGLSFPLALAPPPSGRSRACCRRVITSSSRATRASASAGSRAATCSISSTRSRPPPARSCWRS